MNLYLIIEILRISHINRSIRFTFLFLLKVFGKLLSFKRLVNYMYYYGNIVGLDRVHIADIPPAINYQLSA